MALAVFELIRLVRGTVRYNGSNLVTLAEDQDFSFICTHDLENLVLVVPANDVPPAVSCEADIAGNACSRFLSPDELVPRPRPWVRIAPHAVRLGH